MTHVSSPLGDTLDLDTFAELWAAEGISFGLADASCQPKTTIGSGCSIVSTCEQNELPLPDVSQLYSVKHVLALPDPKKQTTNLVVDKEINKVDPRNMLIEGGKCFDELKVLRLKVEQLLRENTKLHAEALAYRVKRDHFRDSNARYLRITRTYCGNFDRIEAGDAIHDPDGTLALPAGYDGQIGGM
ncbi:hypothetical protein M5689_006276 [Euphorbia peplus]|nr:hypothetical protein M5689_006276 [Euphorbia peplus]